MKLDKLYFYHIYDRVECCLVLTIESEFEVVQGAAGLEVNT